MKKILITLVIVFNMAQLIAQDYKFGKVSKEELEETYYPLDSSANAAILYKKRYTHFEYIQGVGFEVVTDVHVRIKIYNTEGFDWATKSIKYYKSSSANEKVSSLKATTFSINNGKIVETDLSNKDVFDEEINKYWSQQKFTMPNLSPGCIVEWKYKISSPFKSIDNLQFQYGIPVKKMHIEIEIPEYFVYNKSSKGYYLVSPKVEKKRGNIIFNTKSRAEGTGWTPSGTTNFSQTNIDYIITKEIYDVNDVPALIEEPYINNIDNYRATVEYEYSELHWPNEPVKYYANSWEDVTKSIYNDSDFSNQIYKSNHYNEDLAVVLDSAKTNSDKINGILELVKRKIKWNNFNGFTTENGTRQAYKEGVGNAADINLNLVSMLNTAGFKANPVLISTRSHGIPLYPTIEGFNFVIAGVELDDKIILLDATDQNSTPNNLPLRDLNWQGRLIRDDKSSISIDLIPTEPSEVNSKIIIKVDELGEVSGMVRNSYTNLRAINYRDTYCKLKDEDIITKIEDKNKIEIEELRVDNKKDLYKSVVEMYRFNSENLVDRVGDKIYIKPLLFKSETENPFKLEKREYPIDFGTPLIDNVTVSIAIPEGYKVASIPEKIAIGLPNNYGMYLFDVLTSGNSINVKSYLKINTAIYPALDYDTLKVFFKDIVSKNLESIVLEKATL
ncbi:DUF3857 domain-containing protein [Lutibacter sp. HS1-25]|uniref:DUF3857 domain-containing protein n=1 Tax=Lutibacter sp. HS1-25 TaxID=2485000 RepID=UPI001011DCC4|nr:DUF3857 domain-containing protein [Lutibacter sp. HS1-25]RXP57902.1 DUF3857 domain-containing protein [Lutibacter sp. HS1-25]